MQVSLPPEVLELSKVHQLGDFVKFHKKVTFLNIARKNLRRVVLIGTCLAIFMTISSFFQVQLHPSPAYDPIALIVFFMVVFFFYFFLFEVVCGGLQMYLAYTNIKSKYTYEFIKGAIEKRKHKKLEVLCWEDKATILSLWQNGQIIDHSNFLSITSAMPVSSEQC